MNHNYLIVDKSTNKVISTVTTGVPHGTPNAESPHDWIPSEDISQIALNQFDYFYTDGELVKVDKAPPKEVFNLMHPNGHYIPVELPPHEYMTYDFDAMRWVDERELEQVKENHWLKLKAQRNYVEFGGFEFEGNIYDSDQVSQGRIMGAAFAGADQVWTLADNTTVELSALQLQQLYAALQSHVASVHERGRIARLAIEAAEIVEEVEAVQL